jgi:alkylation response protein AidB-like acyl-CoA dehydrogenase
VTLEKLLGDPFDAANPVGFHQVMVADERAELPRAGEQLLDEWDCNAEFVPDRDGGRWSGVDDLARRLRPVFRRDPALGLGYGVTSFMAMALARTAGDSEQRRKMSAELLSGGKIAVAFHELAHGNDFLRNEVTALPGKGGMILNGRKEVINNVSRAGSMVVFARTDDRPGPRSHSLLLLDKQDLPGVRYLPRYRTTGLRGCQLGGVEFTGDVVPVDRVVGEPGSAVEIALRAFQVTRTVLPGMALGVLDSALHVGYRFAAERRLYGHPVVDLPHARDTLACAFADLLVADSMFTAVARGLQVAPGHAAVSAAAVKYLVPLMLEEAMREVSVILGARSYLRDGPQAIFGKFRRDLPVLGIGHAGAATCLLTVIAQLPVLARRAWTAAEPPAELFDITKSLPELEFTQLSIAAGRDPLVASLLAAAQRLPGDEPVHELIRALAAEVGRLARDCLLLRPSELGAAASARAFELAERYTVLLAVAACVGTWLHSPQNPGTPWLHIALIRLAGRLPGFETAAVPAGHVDVMADELARRATESRSCCLDSGQIFG